MTAKRSGEGDVHGSGLLEPSLSADGAGEGVVAQQVGAIDAQVLVTTTQGVFGQTIDQHVALDAASLGDLQVEDGLVSR